MASVYWAVIPGPDGQDFAVEETAGNQRECWKPLFEHECIVGGPFDSHAAAVTAATGKRNSEPELVTTEPKTVG